MIKVDFMRKSSILLKHIRGNHYVFVDGSGSVVVADIEEIIVNEDIFVFAFVIAGVAVNFTVTDEITFKVVDKQVVLSAVVIGIFFAPTGVVNICSVAVKTLVRIL